MKNTRKENTRRRRPAKEPPRPHRGPMDVPRGDAPRNDAPRTEVVEEELQPAEERGERLETGKAVERAGGSTGFVPGATEQSVGPG